MGRKEYLGKMLLLTASAFFGVMVLLAVMVLAFLGMYLG